MYKKLCCRWQTARRGWPNHVIKVRLKKNWFLASGPSRSLKVTGTDTDRSAINDFLLVFYSNLVPKTNRFWDIPLQKCCILENRVRGPSRSLEMSPFDRAHTTSCWRSIYSNYGSISCRFWDIQCEKCRDLEMGVRSHSRSLKVVLLDRLCMVSYRTGTN